MGLCLEFGPQIRPGCGHAMVAGEDACSCPQCGVVCGGRFAGCSAVWAAGPRSANRIGRRADLGLVETTGPVEVVANGKRKNGPARRQLSLGPGVGASRGSVNQRYTGPSRVPNNAAISTDLNGTVEGSLGGDLITEIAGSVRETVRQAMGEVIESHQAVLVTLARVEDNQRVLEASLADLAEATTASLAAMGAFMGASEERNEERWFDLANRVAYLTGQLDLAPPLGPAGTTNGAAKSQGGASSAAKQRTASSDGGRASRAAEPPTVDSKPAGARGRRPLTANEPTPRLRSTRSG